VIITAPRVSKLRDRLSYKRRDKTHARTVHMGDISMNTFTE